MNKKTVNRHESLPDPPDATDRVVQGYLHVLDTTEAWLLRGEGEPPKKVTASPHSTPPPTTDDPVFLPLVDQYMAAQEMAGFKVSTPVAQALRSYPWGTIRGLLAVDITLREIHIVREALDRIQRL